MISRACFDCMTSLLQEPDLRDLCRDGKKLLPGDLTYACRYWARHLAESNLDQSLVDRLRDFASGRLLYWIECLSLIDDLDLGISGLSIVIKVLVVGPRLHACEHEAKYPTSSAPTGSTRSGYRAAIGCPLVLEHFEDMLSISAMYTYTAALQLTPATTRLYQQYAVKVRGHGITPDIEVG
jgi:hypothetical protein